MEAMRRTPPFDRWRVIQRAMIGGIDAKCGNGGN
jgi:hypothetical protein